MYHITIWGSWCFVWGTKPTKVSRGDGTARVDGDFIIIHAIQGYQKRFSSGDHKETEPSFFNIAFHDNIISSNLLRTIETSIAATSGVAKGERSAPGGTFMGAALWASL